METNEQGLTKEEKVMFFILGIILLVSIGVLIINSFSSKDKNLDNNETPITETNGQKENIVDDNVNEPEDILIEEESDSDEIIYSPVVNIPSSSGTNTKEDQSNQKPTPQPIVLDWTFKDSMVTSAFSGDVITIEKNVLLSNGEEQEATIVMMKYENEIWQTLDISSGTITVSEGLYKYIYSYASSTKELLLSVSNKITLETISILKLNEVIDENSSITQEEFSKYQSIVSNSSYENREDINYLTINNYIDSNSLLPIVLTTSEDLTNKILSTNSLGITITKEQKDWHEALTPNSILIWLDLNTIDITNNVIDIEIDGVRYELELNITINPYKEESSDTDQGELDSDQTEEGEDEELSSPKEEEEEISNSDSKEDELAEENSNNVDNEDDGLDPLEPTEEEDIENSSIELDSSIEQETEGTNLQPEKNDISNYSS